MESSEHNSAYISLEPICNKRLIIKKGTFFILLYAGYANQPHDFTNLDSVMSSLLFSIQSC